MIYAKVDQNNKIVQFFIKHWRGELSLWISFWINIVICNIVIQSFLAYERVNIKDHLLHEFNSLYFTFIVTMMFLFLFAFYLVQLVGCWRSARNHKRITKRKLWATIAQVSLLVWILSILIVAIPPLRENFKILINKNHKKEYKISIIDESEIFISGRVTFGLDEELEKMFRQNKNIQLINLNISGGRTLTAEKIAMIIKKNNLSTYTGSKCISACFIIFLAGTNRIMGENATIGLHQSYLPSDFNEYLSNKVKDDGRSYLKDRGISTSLLDKIYNTHNNKIFFPTINDLIENNIITHYKSLSHKDIIKIDNSFYIE